MTRTDAVFSATRRVSRASDHRWRFDAPLRASDRNVSDGMRSTLRAAVILLAGMGTTGSAAAEELGGLRPEQQALCRLPEGAGASADDPQAIAALLGVGPAYAWYPEAGDHTRMAVLYAFSETTGVVVEFLQDQLVAGTRTGAGGPGPVGEAGDTFWRNHGIPKDGGFIGFEAPDWDSDACLAAHGCGSPSKPRGSEPRCPLVEGCGSEIPWGSAPRCPCPTDTAFSAAEPHPPGCR